MLAMPSHLATDRWLSIRLFLTAVKLPRNLGELTNKGDPTQW